MLENIGLIIGLIGLIVVVGLSIYEFIKLGKEKQLRIAKEWLLYMVIEAEKQLGEGTGAIKLRFVYDMFTNKFKFLSMLISFEQFSSMVDDVLDRMRLMLASNEQLKSYVNK